MFAKQPMWLINQGRLAKQQSKNIDQLTAARHALLYYQVKSDPKKQTADIGLVDFLPFPSAWVKYSQEITLDISREVAIAFLKDYEAASSYIKFAIDPVLKEIKLIADTT